MQKEKHSIERCYTKITQCIESCKNDSKLLSCLDLIEIFAKIFYGTTYYELYIDLLWNSYDAQQDLITFYRTEECISN